MIELQGRRLCVVQAGPAFADACGAFALRNREHHRRWSPVRDEAYFTAASWAERLAAAEDEFSRGTAYRFLIVDRERARVGGEINLSNVVRGVFQAAYLGYALDESHVGRGYMHEALALVLPFAFGEGKLHRVMANYMPSNERSGALLRRLGFSVEGFARDYLFINGEWQDHILTALTAEMWSARRGFEELRTQ